MNFITKYKNSIIYFSTIVFSIIFIITGNQISQTNRSDENSDETFYSAKVIKMVDRIDDDNQFEEDNNSVPNTTIYFKAKITRGPIKDTVVEAHQYIDRTTNARIKEVEVGDPIILVSFSMETEDTEILTFAEYNRSYTLILLVLGFFALLILLGKRKGLNTIISLTFTILSIFLVFIPAILRGFNPYFVTCIVSLFIIIASLLIINGGNIKTLCAIIGNIGGLVMAGVLALIMDKVLFLTGIIDNDSIYLLMINSDVSIDLNAIIWSGIVIGSLGAIMDVSMSISSALQEVAEHMEKVNFKKLLKSGFNIGKDAMGTMTNTLILAYVGRSLSMVLLFVAYNKDTLYLMNIEMIVVEIIQAIVGSIGILFAIPITSLFAAYTYSRTFKKKSMVLK